MDLDDPGMEVKFHNGDELTIDDIQFTLDRHHGPEAAENAIHGIFIQQSKRTISQEITGPNTIVVTQTEPNATYPFLMSQLHSSDAHGAVLPKNYWESVGGKEAWEAKPVGAGPLMLVDYKPSEQMLFERFDDYFTSLRTTASMKTAGCSSRPWTRGW